MRKVFLAALAMAASSASHANAWSSCQVVTAITNYTAYSGTITAVLSPGIPGCSSDAPGVASFRIGEMGVTADSLRSLHASLMSAQAMGTRVMIFYNSATSACFASIVSVGGYSAQCI